MYDYTHYRTQTALRDLDRLFGTGGQTPTICTWRLLCHKGTAKQYIWNPSSASEDRDRAIAAARSSLVEPVGVVHIRRNDPPADQQA